MLVKTAEFIISNTEIEKCPEGNIPEYAFIGRSNVGKSSLINMLTNIKGLAKISSKPGKTQLINHFLINKEWYLVDLPGYGYAKVSKELKNKWGKFTKTYVSKRDSLINLFVLIDSRLSPQKIDVEFMEWLGTNGIPFSIVFTKIDKLSSSVLNKNMSAYKKDLAKKWEELPPIFLSSTVSKHGKEEILQYIEHVTESISDLFYQSK